MEQKNNCITDIYWERMNLNVVLNMEQTNFTEIYLISAKEQYTLPVEKLEKEHQYCARINITNIEGKMLDNANYQFCMMGEDNFEPIPIDIQLAYRLESLDKIFQYYRNVYAYTVRFTVKELKNNKMTCILKSTYLKLNKNPRKRCISNKNIKKTINGYCLAFIEKLLQGFYQFSSFLHPNKRHRILLMSETRNPISGNLKALDERLKQRKMNEQYKISYSFSTTLQESNVHVFFKWLKLAWTISKQEFVFVDDYCPLFKIINLSSKTKLIQVWHAGVGFKSVGYARFGFAGPEPFNSCHRKYDFAIVGDESLIPVYEEVFGIEKHKILPYGMPRMDYFLDENKIKKVRSEIYQTYQQLKNKKIILFAPTYRGKGQASAYYPHEMIDFEKISKVCKEKNAVFIIKMHPFIKKKWDIPEEYAEYIQDFSNYPDINELFYITDVLITDYSSNVYEFSKLERPIILYTYDLDQYQLIHKVHRSVREYEFAKVCCTIDELIELLKQTDFSKTPKIKFEKNKMASDLIIDNIILRGNKC